MPTARAQLPWALLERLLRGETVTVDTAFTRWAATEQVAQRGGAYLMMVKADQPTPPRACAEAMS